MTLIKSKKKVNSKQKPQRKSSFHLQQNLVVGRVDQQLPPSQRKLNRKMKMRKVKKKLKKKKNSMMLAMMIMMMKNINLPPNAANSEIKKRNENSAKRRNLRSMVAREPPNVKLPLIQCWVVPVGKRPKQRDASVKCKRRK